MAELQTKQIPKIAYVFPGQGSQAVGMGYDLYQRSPQARQVFEEADQALQFSLSRLCFEGPLEELRETINAQPAILTVSIAYFRAISEFNGTIKASLVAGHSAGEYTALVLAGALAFEDAVALVRTRGELMEEAARENPGGMLTLLKGLVLFAPFERGLECLVAGTIEDHQVPAL